MCVNIHQSVAEMSKQFLAELSRHNYVTPTSYLELLGTFSRLLKLKKSEISNARHRTKTGLDKVRMYVCMYECMYVCMYMCTYACIYVRMYVSLYVHTYVWCMDVCRYMV